MTALRRMLDAMVFGLACFLVVLGALWILFLAVVLVVVATAPVWLMVIILASLVKML